MNGENGNLGAALLACALSYLLGSVPFGLLAGKLRGVDVRAVGSGNIGATNVWRALGPVAGTIVFVLDVAKGFAAPLLARVLVGDSAGIIAACAALAIAGHTFSIWLRFRGGKGIATGFGAMLGLVPSVAIVCLLVWALGLLLSRMISVASIVACVAAPIGAWSIGAPREFQLVVGALITVALIKHIPNMKRIASGTEPKIGEAKIDRTQSDGATEISSEISAGEVSAR